MKTRKLILKVLCMMLFMLFAGNLLAQTDLEMVDLFDEVDEQLSASTAVLTTILYTIAGILLLIGAAIIIPKIMKSQDAGKDIGVWFMAVAFFLIAAYISGLFFE